MLVAQSASRRWRGGGEWRIDSKYSLVIRVGLVAARSGSKEPRLKLRLVSCTLLKKPPILRGLLPTSSTTTLSTPFGQSFAANTSFTSMASNTSVVSFDVVRSARMYHRRQSCQLDPTQGNRLYRPKKIVYIGGRWQVFPMQTQAAAYRNSWCARIYLKCISASMIVDRSPGGGPGEVGGPGASIAARSTIARTHKRLTYWWEVFNIILVPFLAKAFLPTVCTDPIRGNMSSMAKDIGEASISNANLILFIIGHNKYGNCIGM